MCNGVWLGSPSHSSVFSQLLNKKENSKDKVVGQPSIRLVQKLISSVVDLVHT